MPPIRIEYARPEHRRAIDKIEAHAFAALGPAQLRAVARCRRQPGVRLVALEGVEVVGYVAACWFREPNAAQSERSLFVLALAVDEEHRRMGVGRRLLCGMLDRGVARGARSFRLQVQLGNDGATELYRSLGFEPAQRVKDSYGPGRDGVLMVRREAPRER